MATKHTRKSSGRAPLPRRTTRGPLDEEDPLGSSTTTSLSSPLKSRVPSASSQAPMQDGQVPAHTSLPPNLNRPESAALQASDKDLSFLLDPAIYHPLSQLNVAAPFRRPLVLLSPSISTLEDALKQLETVLGTCDYLSAAHLAVSILTSPVVQPVDATIIFQLLGIRYSCLELTDNTTIAAQEAKALEDVTSTFYYREQTVPEEGDENSPDKRALPEHVMPFELRLQALRLQSIGFSDPRRGIIALYDLALECREHIASNVLSAEQSLQWRARLEETGVRVVNALIDMDDLECAKRFLDSMKPSQPTSGPSWTSRMVLLALRIGDIVKAQELINTLDASTDRNTLRPLLAIAEARYGDAVAEIRAQQTTENDDMAVLMKQNLAIAYLYTGNISEAKVALSELIKKGGSFQRITINLATIYELVSDKSKDLKLKLAGEIAGQQKGNNQSRPMSNTDFRL